MQVRAGRLTKGTITKEFGEITGIGHSDGPNGPVVVYYATTREKFREDTLVEIVGGYFEIMVLTSGNKGPRLLEPHEMRRVIDAPTGYRSFRTAEDALEVASALQGEGAGYLYGLLIVGADGTEQVVPGRV